MDDGGNCCVTYQCVMIQNVLISNRLFEISLWQGMLGTLVTDQKHVVAKQIGVTQSVSPHVISLTESLKSYFQIMKFNRVTYSPVF